MKNSADKLSGKKKLKKREKSKKGIKEIDL